jgi:hypothetical protein
MRTILFMDPKGRTWEKLSEWAIAVVPTDPGEHETMPPPLAEMLTDAGRMSLTMPITGLFSWAYSRRDVFLDRQRILGCIYDRGWVCDCLRTLLQQRWLRTDSEVLLESVPVLHGYAVLRMSCGDWSALLMCCSQGTETGDDPLVAHTVKLDAV